MLREREIRVATLAAILLACVTLAALVTLSGRKQRGRLSFGAFMPLSSMVEAAGGDQWKQAAERVKEDRGEPMGKEAAVETPPELRHYSDTRRFLAIQVAEWRERRFETSNDFVDLARLIRQGEMVELKPVGENYILYGVGGSADTEPFTRYERSSGRRIPLYGEAELAQEYARIAESTASLENEIAGLRRELDAAGKRERSRRSRAQSQIAAKEKALKAEREKKEQFDASYGDAQRQQELLADYQTLDGLAKSFPNQTYDMTDANSRQEMKLRMLSFLRPAALKVLEEVAGSYHQKFDRLLPITSLVRPDEYQHQLSKVNPNATLIETPPHSTGLAFDIYYRYMTAEEQAHVMADLARLEDEGRIEVLRENRNHYHVFAFVDGERPSETLIRETLGLTAAKAPKAAEPDKRGSERAEKKRGREEKAKKKIATRGKRR